MKKLFFILSLFSFYLQATGQEIAIDKTRFVGSTVTFGVVNCRYAISTADKGLLFVGETNCWDGGGNIPSSPQDSSVEATQYNILVGKLDSNMNIEWVKVYGGSRLDYATGAVQTSDGGYAVLARTFSNDRDVSGNHSIGSGDLWLIRLDANGNLLWQKCYGSPYDEQPGSITATPDHGFIFFGVSNGMGGDVPNHYSPSQFAEDWFVIKTDSVGTVQWSKTMGGTGDEYPFGKILVADTGYYFISSSTSTDHDCTDTVWHAGHDTWYDYYLFKLDASGNIQWDSSYGGNDGEIAYDAIWDARDSSIVINGVTASSDGSYMVMGKHGDEDMWVIKTDRNGVLKWGKCLGGTNEDVGTGLATTKDGYFVYGSTLEGQVGFEDNWLFALDINGNEYANKQFGGTSTDKPSSIVPFKDGYIATGFTNSQAFTEGQNIGNENGVGGDDYFTQLSYYPLSINNVNQLNVNIHPNPCTDAISVNITQQAHGTLMIMNLMGQIIYKQEVQNENNIEINTTTWQSGQYIIQWRTDDGKAITKKIIKL